MNLTAVLIAGGTSARMGTDKAFLEYRGLPLWHHQLNTLRTLDPAQIIISANRGQHFAVGDALVTRDEFPNKGPLGGIVTAFKNAQHPWVLVLGIDLPLVSPEFLKHELLFRTYQESGVVFTHAGKYQPLAALYPKRLLLMAQENLRRDKLSLQDFVGAAIDQGALQEFPLPTATVSQFTNVNTPADLEKLPG